MLPHFWTDMKASLGPLFALILVAVVALMSVNTYANLGSQTALSIACGSAAIAAMSLTLLLAARPKILESFFGGLDKMYVVHQWLGIAALMFMLGHNTIEPEFEDFVRETRTGDWAKDLGEFAFNSFIALILLSWIKRIPFTTLELPWPLWRFTHRFMDLLFALVAFHQLAIDKPAGLDASLNSVLNALCVLGLLAWLYTQFVAPWLGRRAVTCTEVARHGLITCVTLQSPRPMAWRPGQFVFVAASGAGLQEAHPFTIASAPQADGRLRLAFKALGGGTRALSERIAIGQQLHLRGSYGRFIWQAQVPCQIWLAGGIGITPFLAWAQQLPQECSARIVLLWAVTNRAEAFAAEELRTTFSGHANMRFQLWVSEEQGRLSAQALRDCLPFAARDAELYFCGPQGLLRAVSQGLKALGQSPQRIHSEAFALR